MACEFLNGSCSCSLHRQVGAERVPQDMNTDAAKVCPPCGSGDQSLNESLSQRAAVLGREAVVELGDASTAPRDASDGGRDRGSRLVD